MNKNHLHNGNFIDIIRDLEKSSQESIRGEVNPHISCLAGFLYSDYHELAYKKLIALSNNQNIDIINLYSGFISLCFADYNDNIDFNKILKNLKFENKTYSKLLKCVVSFKKQSKKNNLTKINSLDCDDDLKLLAQDICFLLGNVELKNLSYFDIPLLEKSLLIENDVITLKSFSVFKNLIEKRGLFVILFMVKFHHLIAKTDLDKILNYLVSKNIYNSYLLHLYLKRSFYHDEDLSKFILSYNDILAKFGQSNNFSISHYFLLYCFIKNDHESLVLWFNQFSEDQVTYDEDGNLNYYLENNKYKAVSYENALLNARFYLNTIHHLTAYRSLSPSLYNTINRVADNKHSINVIGGVNALSWTNICTESFHTFINFSYTDFFNKSDNTVMISDKFIKSSNSNVLVFDVEHFNDKDIVETITHYIKKIQSISGKQKLFVVTIPKLSDNILKNFSYINEDPKSDVTQYYIKRVEEINSELFRLAKNGKFTLIDVNDYLNADNFVESKNLLNNFIVKPDIIIKMINESILSH